MAAAGYPCGKLQDMPSKLGNRIRLSTTLATTGLSWWKAATDLANPVWVPVATNTITGIDGLSYFGDPNWTNYPGRFYRLRSP